MSCLPVDERLGGLGMRARRVRRRGDYCGARRSSALREALSKVKAVGFLPRNLVKNRIGSTAAR